MGSDRTAGNLFRVTKGAPPAHPLDECAFLSLRQTEAAAWDRDRRHEKSSARQGEWNYTIKSTERPNDALGSLLAE
jgi:hypothetical protein